MVRWCRTAWWSWTSGARSWAARASRSSSLACVASPVLGRSHQSSTCATRRRGVCHMFEHSAVLQLTGPAGRIERRPARRRATLARAASPVSSAGRTATATQCARAPIPCCACPHACSTTRSGARPGTRQELAVASSIHPSHKICRGAGGRAMRPSTTHAAVVVSGPLWHPASTWGAVSRGPCCQSRRTCAT
jgi:hypothetical protein